jgi:indolepyruvate ferredoxin oxidoreductase
MKRKLKLGRWFVPVFRMLRAMRRLRGTPLDPFGAARVRRMERALIGEYEELVAGALRALTPESHGTAVELAELPDVIRGYEGVKLESVARFREGAEALAERLEAAATPGG